MNFFWVLKDSFEDAHGRIMSVKPLPTMEEAFNMIKCEESQKVLTKSHTGSPSISISPSLKVSTLALHGTQEDSKRNKVGCWCNHRNKKGHTWEVCWKLHDKPSNNKQKSRSDSKVMMVGPTLPDNGSLSTKVLLVLRKILDKHGNQPAPTSGETHTPSVTLAQAGLILRILLCGG